MLIQVTLYAIFSVPKMFVIPEPVSLNVSDLSCAVEVDHFGQFVRKARTRTCKATTDPVWDQVSSIDQLD